MDAHLSLCVCVCARAHAVNNYELILSFYMWVSGTEFRLSSLAASTWTTEPPCQPSDVDLRLCFLHFLYITPLVWLIRCFVQSVDQQNLCHLFYSQWLQSAGSSYYQVENMYCVLTIFCPRPLLLVTTLRTGHLECPYTVRDSKLVC